ncbi:MAG: gliding motility-associated C-terminal domain-containing protein, partial [Chitinophagales bacterium]
GEYTLIVTDENGCSDQLSFTTFDEAAPQLSGGIIDPSNCEQADGNITDINIEGGNPPYTYAWTNADGESHGEEISLSNAPQGNYVLTATDVDGCSTTLSFEILDTEAPVLVGGVIAPTTCSEANGSIEEIEVNGGNGELTFVWLDSENSEISADLNLNTVLAGTYTFIATDEEGCTAELQFEIPDEAAPQVIEGLVNNARCSEENGGISNVIIEGGIPPYSYNWTDASNNGYENTGENEATLLNIAAGVYDLEVMDANGCVASLAFEVLDEASPVASGGVVNASTCSEENGSIEGVEIEGGTAPFRFEWRDTNGNLVSEAENLSGVLAGNYAVQIIDDNGCETDLAFEIPNIAAPILSEGTIDLSSCGNSDGGVLGVKVEGGTEPYAFTWQDKNGEIFGDEIDLTNVTAGTYTLIVTDFNNCDVSLGFNVSDVGAPSISGGTPNQTVCGSQDGEITGIEVSGGTGALAIRWTNLEGEVISENLEISDLSAGEYTFTVEDEGGCIASQSFVIDDIPPPLILGATLTPASCGASDGRISEIVLTDGSAPFRFEWSNADTNEVLGEDVELGGLTAGTYILIVMDDNNCSDSREFVLENLDAPELSLDDVTISDCTEEGTGSATVKVLGGTAPFDFEWDTDPPQFAPTASNLKPGNYNVSVRDGNDCLAVLPVTVPGFMPSPIVDCSLQTTESLEFVWTAVIGAVGYSIETDLGITDTVPAEQLSYLLAGIPDDLTVVISVTALGPDFCDNSETVIQSCATLADCPTIELSIEAANDIFCINEAGMVLDASPEGGVFEGTGMNGNSFDPALAGVGEHTISYTFVDEMGCDFSASQILNVVEAPIAAIEMPEVICLGENTEISFIGTLPEGASLQWDFGNGTTSNEIGSHSLDWNETGVYTVQLSVDNGVCVDATEVELIVSDINIEASEDQTVRSGTDIDLSAIVNTEFGNLESLEWLPSLENLTGCIDCPNTTARPFEATNYTVVATNEHGCQAVADVGVEIIPVPVLVIPNAFSPNSDGINDFFKIEGRNIESIEIKIYSRWGQKVFEGHSLDDAWDGIFKEEPLELGVYVYYARAFSFDGEEVFVKGNISLIR